MSELAHVAAIASLDDAAELARRRELNERGRADLVAALAAARDDGRSRPARTSSPSTWGTAARSPGALEADGVIVRPLEPFGAPGSVRITVGTPDENAVFADALRRALQPR